MQNASELEKAGDFQLSTKKIKIEDGPAQSCSRDLHPMHLSRVCSMCKVSMVQKGNFSQSQRRKGAFAKCNTCVESSKADLIASVNTFRQNKAALQRAEDDAMGDADSRVCSMCGVVKSKDCFHIFQQKLGARAKCIECLKKLCHMGQEKRRLGDEAEKLKGVDETDKSQNTDLPSPDESPSKKGVGQHTTDLESKNVLPSPGTGSNENVTALKPEGMKSSIDTKGHQKGVKRTTTTTESELDDGTKTIETEYIEVHPDGSTIKRVKRESVLEKSTSPMTVEKIVTTTTTEITTKMPQEK